MRLVTFGTRKFLVEFNDLDIDRVTCSGGCGSSVILLIITGSVLSK